MMPLASANDAGAANGGPGAAKHTCSEASPLLMSSPPFLNWCTSSEKLNVQ